MDFTLLSDRLRYIPLSPRIYNLTGSSMALFLALQEKPFVMIESSEEAADELYRDILFFNAVTNKQPHGKIYFLPEPGGHEASGQRAEIIYNFNEGDSIITSKDAFSSRVWPQDELKKGIIHLEAHLEMQRNLLDQKLLGLGYKNVSVVVEQGEFSRRGWLFDVFPSTAADPLRLEFFGDKIEKIRVFDISTQKSIKDIREFEVLPASEPPEGTDVLSVIKNSNCFYSDSIHPPFDPPDESIALSKFSFTASSSVATAKDMTVQNSGEGFDAGLLPIAGYGLLHNERKSIYEFPEALKKLFKNNRVVIAASSKGQAERLKEVLANGDVIAPIIQKQDVGSYAGAVVITEGELSSGFFLEGLLVLAEKEIFGERPAFRPLKRSKVSELLLSLDDLSPGDLIVHTDHGIGRFTGLVKQISEGYEGDVMILEYSGGDRLYLPLYRISAIKKYHAEEGVAPNIDRLGGKSWLRTKERVRKKIREMTEKLLKLYAERQVSRGFVFSEDSELHIEFDDFFPYEETPDQIRATAEIKSDMESDRPMDRLLCGDVGYGKTEVAMKAAFKAVYDGRQVAVLVPTTLLCEQHYRTFKQRFSAFPVTIDYLSRFKSKKEQTDAIKKAAQGDVDILIGTHALLRKDIVFHNLGLLVIDEEHRFGVAQKEKIKELRKGVDVLTLTATPIPRTLNMALSGIRGMSLIETPPEERLAVRTVVSSLNEGVVKDAIRREMERGGQIYFVHNRIADIEKIADFVRKVVPEARISVAHGQMNERRLEKIMQQFVDKDIDVLVSTAIIGSGLDIPSANTIIINRADMMGLADLYQLRGRVGRSNVRAYAYFLVPGEDLLTDEAKKRIQAVQDMSYLGAGFRLAMKDLEIRGTGNLLGSEQSGHIHAVGFDMYVEMLEKAVAELKGVKTEEEADPRINLKVSAFISEEFIDDITLRLSAYRRLASAKTEEDLMMLESELKDRFGELPPAAENLFDIMRLKMLAKKLMISDIIDANGNVRMIFSKDTKVTAENVLGLRDNRIKFLQDGLEIKVRNLEWKEVYNAVREILEKLF